VFIAKVFDVNKGAGTWNCSPKPRRK